MHSEFTQAPRGNIGDRDQIVFDGVRLDLQEAQYVAGDYSTGGRFSSIRAAASRARCRS